MSYWVFKLGLLPQRFWVFGFSILDMHYFVIIIFNTRCIELDHRWVRNWIHRLMGVNLYEVLIIQTIGTLNCYVPICVVTLIHVCLLLWSTKNIVNFISSNEFRNFTYRILQPKKREKKKKNTITKSKSKALQKTILEH